jgi:predicted amidohydrolase YtcJ
MERPTIYANGAVFTGVQASPWVEAVVVHGADVVATGSLQELRDAHPSADEHDLAGGTLLPGLVDAHNHFLSTGESLASLDLRYPGVDSAQALLAVVSLAAVTAPAGETIVGFGFDNRKYALPTLADLDAAAGEHPVQLFHTSGHNVLVNSVVLRRSGVDDATQDPPGGTLVRDAAGRLTGLCLDAACGLVVPAEVDIGSHGPNFHVRATLDSLVAAVDRAGRAFVASGLTCVADAQVTSRELRAYREARDRGVLRLRTVCMPLSHQLDELIAVGMAGPFGDDVLSIGHLKVYADGSLTGGTTAFSEGLGVKDQNGTLFHQPDDLRALVARAWDAGWRIGTHAQGDRAIAYVLEAYEQAARRTPRSDARPRIEHAGYPGAVGVQRMAGIGAIAVTQPSYLHDYGDEYLDSLGPLAHDLQPWRDELVAGVRVVISSDSDVSSYRPLTTIANALLRRTMHGELLGPRHRLTLDEALFAHTRDAAFAVGLERRVGTLEPGKAADLVWLEDDLRHLPAEAIAEVEVRATIVDGRAGHDSGDPG